MHAYVSTTILVNKDEYISLYKNLNISEFVIYDDVQFLSNVIWIRPITVDQLIAISNWTRPLYLQQQ